MILKLKMNRKIVIWGDDHHNALGLLRMLGGRGYDILFLVHKVNKNIATSSKYCTNYVVVANIAEGLEYLTRHYEDNVNKAVLLFTADKFSEAANNNYSLLSKYFYIAGVPKNGGLSEIDDKYTMGVLANECGIKIPKTFLWPNEDISEAHLNKSVIKPCSPAFKDFKIKICNSEKDLLKQIASLRQCHRYVIQEFISKEADGLIYGCRTIEGKTILSGICIRNRWSDDNCGSFGYISSEIPNSINQDGIRLFLEKIDFKGLFSVEYAMTSNDSYFYEFNLRNDGTSVLFYNAGANPALTYVNSCFGLPDDESAVVRTGKQYLMNEFWDEFNVNDGIVTKKKWLEEKGKATIFFYYDSDDMKPYEIQKSQTNRRRIRRIIAKSLINKIRLKIKNKIKNRNL